MKLDEVIDYFGSQARVCEYLKIHKQNFTNWIKRGYIPYMQQLKLEKLTGGRLKADYSALTQLRPNHSEKIKIGIRKNREKNDD